MRRTLSLLGLAALMCSSMMAQQPMRRVAVNSFSQPESKPVYQKWLSEDVAYIITPEETRAFTMLKTDDEREQFIESFWRRRDAKPETDENEYRAEHYARIAHANENFGFADVAGWRTDRGRIYITYGKPDQVQKTSSSEVWIYNRLPVAGSGLKFEFVMTPVSRDFRLRQ